MATIRTAIELQDNFTSVLYQVINSVNLGLSAMEDLHQSMNAQVDTSSIEAARDSINQATIAVQELDAAMQGVEAPTIPTPTAPVSTTPVNIPTPQPTQWQSYDGLEVFKNTGVERFEQEVASVNSMLQDLNATQSHITQAAAESEVLSPQARYDVEAVENRVQALQQSIEQVEQNPLNIGSDSANASLEQLRARLSETLELQDNLNAAMQGADISQINAAYLQLSQNISETERMVRDSFENIPPVEIPVTWKTDSLEVFTSTGVDRFQQEVQSANNMLNTLNTTQEHIASTAAQTNLFPASAVADMGRMGSRLQAIQQRIQQIENNPLNIGTETANAELERLRGQLDQAIQEQENLNRAVDDMDVQAANEAYLRLSQTIGNTESYIRDNVDEQGRFNQEINEGVANADNLMNVIKGAVAAYATVQTVGKVLDLSDTLTSTTARLNLMNDGLQTTQDLQNMIYLSAERARGSYQATADAVSKLGLMAGDAFGSSQEIIAFMEQVNKQFTIAGTEAAGVDAAMLQLTQAMASGVLRGEELNSIFEQAPTIIQTIADYLDVPIGSIREMAAEGQITADIVKSAMFAAADETNEKFASMPKTFSQIWTSFQNTALMAFQPVLNRLNEIANSDAFQQFVNNAIEGLSVVAGVALEIFDLLVSVAGAVADNWSWLSPIIYGVAAALAVYYGWQLAVNMINAISKGIHVAMAVAQMIHAAATGALTAATAAEIAEQNGLNAALYACPIVWIIVLITALIALFYAAVAAVNKFAGTSVSATGIICGAFMVALAFIGNIFVALWNLVVDVFVLIYNLVATVANFIGNVFTDPIGAICRLFFDLADTVLGILQALASAIDAIFGSNLAGSVQGWRDSLGGWVDDTFGKGEEVMAKMNADDMKLGRFEYGEAWDAGYSFGEGIDQSIANFDPSSLFDTNVPGADDYANLGSYGSGIGGIGSGVDDIAGNTGKIADSMDITEEDLKYLRDIAEQEAVNRFTTAEITIEQTNHNTVSGKMDLDGIVSGLTDAANEAVDKIAEGVHE